MKKIIALATVALWVHGLYALDGPYYDPAAEVTIEGTIVEINVSPPAYEGDTLLQLKVVTKSGKEIEAYICPSEYIKIVTPKSTVEVSPGEETNVSTPKSEIEVKPGESVHITTPGVEVYVDIPGHREFCMKIGEEIRIRGAKIQNHKGNAIIAREVYKEKEKLRLRDRTGFPLWLKHEERKHVKYNIKKEMKIKGKVVKLHETTPPRGFYPLVEAVIRTPDKKEISVMLGPSWYMEGSIKIGDPIEVIGSFVKTDKGEVMICREFKNERLNLQLQLRNKEGSPLWMSERPEGMEGGEMGTPGGEYPGTGGEYPGGGTGPRPR